MLPDEALNWHLILPTTIEGLRQVTVGYTRCSENKLGDRFCADFGLLQDIS